MTAPSQPSFLLSLSLSAADACGLGLSLSKGRAAAAATPLPPSPRQKFNVLSPDSLVLYSLLSHAFFHYLLLLFCYSLAFFFLLHKLWIVLILLVLGLQKTMYPLHSSIDWPSNFFTTPLWKKGWNFFLKVSKF